MRPRTLLTALALVLIPLPLAAQAACGPGGTCNAAAKLQWVAPTTNTDGSALTDFAGFRVLTGASAACSSLVSKDVGALGVAATPAPNATVSVTLGSLGLAQGPAAAVVKAYDTGGNLSACSAEVTFTFDSVPPDTTITATPPAQAPTGAASFTFTSSEAGSTFECKLDAAAFAPCVPPKAYTGLAEGIHTFQVRAIDAALNVDPAAASYTWSVNAVPPAAPGAPTVVQ